MRATAGPQAAPNARDNNKEAARKWCPARGANWATTEGVCAIQMSPDRSSSTNHIKWLEAAIRCRFNPFGFSKRAAAIMFRRSQQNWPDIESRAGGPAGAL